MQQNINWALLLELYQLVWWILLVLVSERVNSELDVVLLQKEYISSLKTTATTTSLLPHSYTEVLLCSLAWPLAFPVSVVLLPSEDWKNRYKVMVGWLIDLFSELETPCNFFLSWDCIGLALFGFTPDWWLDWNVNACWAFLFFIFLKGEISQF